MLHGHIWPWTVAPFQRSQGGRQWFDMHQKCNGEVSLHLQFELNVLGLLIVSTDKKLWD
jgi:hypothetical protein